nr:MAG TPA: hypothetical protein [Caudoviricetes sp.]
MCSFHKISILTKKLVKTLDYLRNVLYHVLTQTKARQSNTFENILIYVTVVVSIMKVYH